MPSLDEINEKLDKKSQNFQKLRLVNIVRLQIPSGVDFTIQLLQADALHAKFIQEREKSSDRQKQ